MSIDWDKLSKEKFAGNGGNYATPGVYKTTLNRVEAGDASPKSGAYPLNFYFNNTDDDKRLPKATHWLSVKNPGWRQWHFKCLMVVLGASEDAAKKAVEVCESKEGDAMASAYEATFNKLVAKKKAIEVEVWKDVGSKYSDADFADSSVSMGHDDKSSAPVTEETADEGGELNIDDIPFD